MTQPTPTNALPRPTDDDLIALANGRHDALVALTQRLVRLPSETPPSDTGATVALAREALEGLPGLTLRTLESEPPIVNLVARLEGGLPGKRLILSGHLDTYPIGDRAAWAEDPLGGAIVDGALYGRGSGDMKGGCAVLIETVRVFAERMRPFPGEIVLALAGDEERMGELGTQWLIDHVPEVRGDGVIVADVGGPAIPRLGEKGMLWLELRAEGHQAHGAHTHAGRNALDAMMAALADLRTVEALAPAPPPEAVDVMAAAALRPGADGPDARATMQHVTVNLGCLSGGVSPNLVPASAEAAVDIRIPLGVSLAALRGAVNERLRRHPAVSAIETRAYEATWTPRDSAIAAATINAAETVFAEAAFPDMRIGGSDARLWRRAGLPTVVLGLSARHLGSPDEHCELSEFAPLLAAHAIAARRFLGA